MAALEAHDHVGLARQSVHDLAFALVAPLGADDGHICHIRTSFAVPNLDTTQIAQNGTKIFTH
jgi:hypothetical protein